MKARKKRKYPQITRFDYGRSHAWWVRIEREGFVRRRLFSDGAYGGRWSALEAAQKYRDIQLRRAPIRKNGKHGKQLLNQEGNCKRQERYVYVRGKKPYAVDSWVVWIKVSPYRLASSNWSIEKWGVREAKRRALEWLEAARKRQKRNYRGVT